MICLFKKKHGIKQATIWLFDSKCDVVPECDTVSFVQSIDRRSSGREFLSLKTILNEDEDVLFAKIEKQTRYEIRRIDKESPQAIYLGFNDDISEDALSGFFADYDSFADSKGLHHINRGHLRAMARQKILILAAAMLQETILVYHTYVFDANKTRLLNSVSMFRSACQFSSNQIGMLNRWLHWSDIKYFKQQGLKFLDWGGINYKNPEIANITKFKKEFGGEEWIGYSSDEAVSFRGRAYNKIVNIVKNVGF